MKVKVVRRSSPDNWYAVGEVYDVKGDAKWCSDGGGRFYPLEESDYYGVGVNDCEIIEEDVPPPVYFTGEKPALTQADQLAARIEAANQMAANLPEKTLWDEYAMAALSGFCADCPLGDDYLEVAVDRAAKLASYMMEARKNK